ncbi:MAG TPA: M23 family metallopeptidase [Thiolinea sp.]|nr:M23 family metallopeptidase [Thiolinea sp.]
MKIICVSHDGTRRSAFDLNPVTHLVLPAVLITLLIIALSVNQMLGLFRLADTPQAVELTEDQASLVMETLRDQVLALSEVKRQVSSYTVDVDTLALRLGSMEAEMARVNAIASRVIRRAQLDPDEFQLDQKPPRGGLEEWQPASLSQLSSQQLLAVFDHAEQQLGRQRSMLEGLSQVLEGFALEAEVQPTFRPVDKGYVSSRFGIRSDPFNGRQRVHKGIDFAGPRGTAIHAVAGGVVSFAGVRGGYGTTVEIDHGGGLVSRYAHLNKALVKSGEVVNKADRIALLGSTGRSTGPHLHLEIMQDGKAMDPALYLGYVE